MDAMCITETSDPQHFSQIWNELENGTILGDYTNMYHANIDKAYGVLCKYNTPSNSMCINRNRAGAIFHQRGGGKHTFPHIAGTNYVFQRYVMWYNFDRQDHYSGQFTFPDRHRIGKQPLQLVYYFAQTNPAQKYLINPNYILLESCSNVSYTNNPYLLSDIKYWHLNTAIYVFTNGGHLEYKQSGTMDMLPLRVFYNPDYIANILELVDVTSQLRVTMDTKN